jgi:hypothetical protein
MPRTELSRSHVNMNTASVEWTASLPVEGATKVLRAALLQLEGDVSDSGEEGTLAADFGSRLQLRMLGVLVPGGEDRLPLHCNLEVRPGVGPDDCKVRVEMRATNTGYLFQFDKVDKMYSEKFDAIVTALQTATA